MTVVEWGTKYQVFDSVTVVHVQGRLVDTDTGIVLWDGEHAVRHSSSSGQNGIIGMLVEAVVNQVIASFTDPSQDVARMTNSQLFLNKDRGLLVGQRSGGYESNQREHREIMNRTISENAGP
jgi:hypothetical protein